ncbi:MAG: VWA domain-containing protein [Terriglobales bacterium]
MFTHLHPWSILLALLTLTCALAAEDKKDAADELTFRNTVSEVRVTFFATDEKNRPPGTVTKSDFVVVDGERVVRSFRSFTHADETSLELVALVDVSGSVAPRFRTAMSDVVQLITREQSIPSDNISVVSFGGMGPVILCASSCRASDSLAKLQAVKSDGLTPLFDALMFAADFVSQHRRDGVRPVLVLFSDGDDTISLHTPLEALEAVQAAGAAIYAVDLGTSDNRSSNQSRGSVFLRHISEATGGRYFTSTPRVSHVDDVAAVVNAVLEDLQASYVVTYELPSHQPGFHSLRLLPTHNLNLTFHSRNGYNYEPNVH